MIDSKNSLCIIALKVYREIDTSKTKTSDGKIPVVVVLVINLNHTGLILDMTPHKK